MADEKIYLGKGRKNDKYDINNVEIELHNVIKHMYEKTKDNRLFDAFKILLENAGKIEKGFSTFKFKNGKNGCNLKITVSGRKTEGNYGETHSVTLNTFVPDKESKKVRDANELPPHPEDSDMPF